jgi:hypothetical protein
MPRMKKIFSLATVGTHAIGSSALAHDSQNYGVNMKDV